MENKAIQIEPKTATEM
jgi:hypothetical protein